MIRFENVGLRYGMGPEILRDVNLSIPEGSFQFLTGASGAGSQWQLVGAIRVLILPLPVIA